MIPGAEHQRWFSIDPRSHPSPAILAANIVLVVACVAVAARISVPVPGTPVPQSLQTLAVALGGMWLGPIWGPVAMLAYAGAGAANLPVFADGASGVAVLTGPTAGYLGGFVLGAAVTGWTGRRPWISAASGFVWAAGAALVAHAVILGCGWGRLAALVGPEAAFASGVSPFLVGGAAKSIVAAAIWVLLEVSRPPD